jgi:CDP-glucose 4,6-dehydratase
LDDLAQLWGLPAGQKAYDVVAQVPFHEAGLLKLNCDKALLALRWSPTLEYRECVTLTGDWYRLVLREHADARAVTMSQIALYESLAAERGQPWQCGVAA